MKYHTAPIGGGCLRDISLALWQTIRRGNPAYRGIGSLIEGAVSGFVARIIAVVQTSDAKWRPCHHHAC